MEAACPRDRHRGHTNLLLTRAQQKFLEDIMGVRKYATAVAALGLASGAVLLGPAVAHASPTGCFTGYLQEWPEGGYASCVGGDGHYRAQIYCTDNPAIGYGAYYFGPWEQPYSGSASQAQCSSSYPYIVAAGYQTGV